MRRDFGEERDAGSLCQPTCFGVVAITGSERRETIEIVLEEACRDGTAHEFELPLASEARAADRSASARLRVAGGALACFNR
jgi:hypothetical protein